MKILIIAIREKGGVGRYCEEVKKEFDKLGHKIEIVYREDDMDCYSLNSYLKFVNNFIKNKEFDIIYTQDWSCAIPFLKMKNHFCCYHGLNPSKIGGILQYIIGRKMKRRLICVGDNIKKYFPKAKLIYEGINMEMFKPLGLKRDCLGWIERCYSKGDKFGVLNKKRIELLAKSFNLKPLIAKNIPKKEMNLFYNKCKIFICLPPKYAGFNLAWLEAMSAGVPIIVGNNCGIGSKLPINQIEYYGNNLYKTIDLGLENNYKPLIDKKKFNWESHTKQLIKLFKSEK